MEDSTEELSDVVARAQGLWSRMRTVSAESDAASWFALWRPVVAAVVRLGQTLLKLVLRLRQVADDDAAEFDEDLKDELLDDLRDIGREFPDVADVLFGLRHLDDLYVSLIEDASARAAASALADAAIGALDKLVAALVDIVLGHREAPVDADRIVAVVTRYEELAQRLLDRWLRG